MANTVYSRQGSRARQLRKQAGRYIKHLREDAGKTQMEVSKSLGYEYYTFISQVEQGTSRVPPESYESWAKVLEVPVKQFAKTLLAYYDPETFVAIFGKEQWEIINGNNNNNNESEAQRGGAKRNR